MSRKARKQSPTGIHHILVQGPHYAQIFANGEQKSRYLETIQKYHEQGKVKLYAYCILDNSANILIEEAEDSVAQFMRRVGISYVHWFNRARQREGPLFRDRYTSQPVSSDQECMRIIRFIHQLPVRMGLVKRMEDYYWSSYWAYLDDRKQIDTGELMGQLGDWEYERYMRNNWQDSFLREKPPRYYLSDEKVTEMIQERLDGRTIDEMQNMDEQELVAVLRQLRFQDHISIAQLSRVTHLGKSVIQRIKPDPEE